MKYMKYVFFVLFHVIYNMGSGYIIWNIFYFVNRWVHVYSFVYLEAKWPLFWVEKEAFFMRGWPSNREVKNKVSRYIVISKYCALAQGKWYVPQLWLVNLTPRATYPPQKKAIFWGLIEALKAFLGGWTHLVMRDGNFKVILMTWFPSWWLRLSNQMTIFWNWVRLGILMTNEWQASTHDFETEIII